MEMAYHDLNQREYELTKHVSLLQIDPLALVQLRATGSCLFTMPEEVFDLDCPGHYFRRIKIGRRHLTLRGWALHQRELRAHAASRAPSAPAASLGGRLRSPGLGRSPLQRLLRHRAVHRHQFRAIRQRPVRNQPARRALPAFRGVRRGRQPVAAKPSRRHPPVRLRHHHRRRHPRPLHRSRRRRCARRRRRPPISKA